MPATSTVAAVTLSDSMMLANAAAHLFFKVIGVSVVIIEKIKAVFYLLIFKSAREHRNRVCQKAFCYTLCACLTCKSPSSNFAVPQAEERGRGEAVQASMPERLQTF